MYVHVYMLGESGGVRNIFSARVRITVIKHRKNVVFSEQCIVDWGIPVYDRNPNDQWKCGDRMGMDKP